MDKTDYLGTELASLGIESARNVLNGRKVTVSIEGSPHTRTYVVEGVQPPLMNPGIALIISPAGANFTVPVGLAMRVTIMEGG